MFQAGFRYNSHASLVPSDGNPESRRWGIPSWVIHSVYEAFYLNWFSLVMSFMHDSASIYTARIIGALLSDIQIQRMVWPAYSPDLNPIENVWAVAKGTKMYERQNI
jgi:hypothetical protein